MEEIIGREANSSSVQKLPALYGNDKSSSLPRSQDSVTCLHPDPNKFSPYTNQLNVFKIYF